MLLMESGQRDTDGFSRKLSCLAVFCGAQNVKNSIYGEKAAGVLNRLQY